MAKSESGRIVVELDPAQKRRLYSALAMENKTLKKWLMEQVNAYLARSKESYSRGGDGE